MTLPKIKLVQRLPEKYVLAQYAKLYEGGKHKEAPEDWQIDIFRRHPIWVEVEIPHDLYRADWQQGLSPRQIARAQSYADQAGKLPPGMATYGAYYFDGIAVASDGNHRAYAAVLRGDKTASFYMSWDDYQRFIKCHPNRVVDQKIKSFTVKRRNPDPPSDSNTHTQNTIKIGPATLVYLLTPTYIKLYSLRVPTKYRKHGAGRYAMTVFLKIADESNLPVYLDASPLDKTTQLGKLIKFYQSLGFQPTGKRANMAGDPEMLRSVGGV